MAPCSCCDNYRELMSSKFSRSNENRRAPDNEKDVLDVTVSVEAVRTVAYINFFIMIGCAVVIFNARVVPRLAAGPVDAEGNPTNNTCGSFDGALGDRVDPPVLPGEGFDAATQSHLVRAFGYNNVCATWDYSPSREITAMVYPLFEYALLLYLFFDFVQTLIYYKKGWVSQTYYRVFLVVFLPIIIGCSWFRMIFVVIAYMDLSGHTAGFFCLQITLILVAMMNTYFILDSKAEYSWLGGRKGTIIVASVYIFCNLIISPIKLYLTAEIVFKGRPAPWSLNMVAGNLAGQTVDNLWTVFNAVIPLFVSVVRAFSEPSLKIKVDVPPSKWTGEDGHLIQDGAEEIAEAEKFQIDDENEENAAAAESATEEKNLKDSVVTAEDERSPSV